MKLGDIDSKTMRIRVVQRKGGKDRYAVLSGHILPELRDYWLIFRPEEYLFCAQGKEKGVCVRSIQHPVCNALIGPGLKNKNYSVHTLHHSFAAHLLEAGTGIYYIQNFLGHKSMQTTLRYTPVSQLRTPAIHSPLNRLNWSG